MILKIIALGRKGRMISLQLNGFDEGGGGGWSRGQRGGVGAGNGRRTLLLRCGRGGGCV
mgnify:CR=1 FL=1